MIFKLNLYYQLFFAIISWRLHFSSAFQFSLGTYSARMAMLSSKSRICGEKSWTLQEDIVNMLKEHKTDNWVDHMYVINVKLTII
jgi:hypothetical protein